MAEMAPGPGLSENLMNEDDLKASYAKDVSVCLSIVIIVAIVIIMTL